MRSLIFLLGIGLSLTATANCTYFFKYDYNHYRVGIDGKRLEKDGFYQKYAADEVVRLAELKKSLANKGYTEVDSEDLADQKISIGSAMICRGSGCGWPAAMNANYVINGHEATVNVYNTLHWIKGISPEPYDNDIQTRKLVISAFKKAQGIAFRSYAKDLPACGR
jgi:hypothetical protein